MSLLGEAYITGEHKAIELIGKNYTDSEIRKTVLKSRGNQKISSELYKILLTYNQTLPPSKKREENLADLQKTGTVVVITGQQTGFFLGPLLTYYKALSAILTAKSLEKESGQRTVPLFWLQSEDHDYKEINHCNVPDSQLGTLKLEVPSTASERIPVKNILLGEEISSQLTLLKEKVSHYKPALEIVDLFSKHYQTHVSIVDAFAHTLATFFADEGLIIFDPRTPGVSSLMAPVFSKALLEHEQISGALKAHSEKIELAGFQPQVHVRENSPLFFYHHGPETERYRLQRKKNAWNLIGTEISIDDQTLRTTLQNDPASFSSSALLRPIVQDSLFPTAAYIGGAAELAYFAQITPLYSLFQIEKPLIIPRARFILSEEKQRGWLQELGLTIEELRLPVENLVTKKLLSKVGNNPDPQKLESATLSQIEAALDSMQTAFGRVDPTLVAALEKSKEKIFNQIHTVITRYERALAGKEDINAGRIQRLKQWFFPEDLDQERYYGAAYFLCRYGSSFKQELINEFTPYSGKFVEVPLRD